MVTAEDTAELRRQRPYSSPKLTSHRGASDTRVSRTAVLILEGVLVAVAGCAMLFLASTWMLFRKAGVGGWKAFVPFFNWWTFLQVAGLEGWLSLVPGLNIAVTVFVAPFQLAKRFGRSALFGMGLAVMGVIFYPLLAFGSARYVGKLGS